MPVFVIALEVEAGDLGEAAVQHAAGFVSVLAIR